MKRPFAVISSTFSATLLLVFAVPACDLEDESEFRNIQVEEPPCECVCIDEIPEEDPDQSGTDPSGKGNGKGKGKTKTKRLPRDNDQPNDDVF